MADIVADFLASQGIVVDEKEFAHYGVKGMKWGKSKGESNGENEPIPAKKTGTVEGGGDFGDDGDGTTLTDDGMLTTFYSSKEEVEDWGKRNKTHKLFDVTKTSKTYNFKTGKMETRSATRQGKINSFIEKAFSNLFNPKGNSKKK